MGIESLSDADLFALKANRLDKVSDAGLEALKQPTAEVPVQQRPKTVLERNFPDQYPYKLGGTLDKPLGEGKGPMEILSDAAYGAGGRVTDVLSSLPAPIAAGAGYATNVGLQSLPMFIGGAVGKLLQPSAKGAAESLMQSAIKPTPGTLTGNIYGQVAVDAARNPTLAAISPTQQGIVKGSPAKQAIETMLEEGISVSPGGVAKMRGLVDDLNNKITAAIQSSGATVDKSQVASRINDVVSRIERTNPTPQDALKDVEKVYTQFMQNGLVPKNIPVTQAQELKQGIYRVLRDKYGTISSDTNEALKGLALGFKEEVAGAVPAISNLNKQESKLLNALSVSEQKILSEANKNKLGISLMIKDPLRWGMFMADKSPLFKSMLARMLYSGKVPETAGLAAGGAYSAIQSTPSYRGSLAEIANQQNNQ